MDGIEEARARQPEWQAVANHRPTLAAPPDQSDACPPADLTMVKVRCTPYLPTHSGTTA